MGVFRGIQGVFVAKPAKSPAEFADLKLRVKKVLRLSKMAYPNRRSGESQLNNEK